MGDTKHTGRPATALRTLQVFWQFTKQHPKECYFTLLLPVANILLSVIMPLYASRILAALVTNRTKVWQDFIVFVAVAIVGAYLNRVGIRHAMALQARVMGDIHTAVFDRLMQRSVGFYNNRVGGKLVSDAMDFQSAYGLVMNAGYYNVLSFLVTVIVGLAIVALNSWQLGLLLFVLLATLTVWTHGEQKRRTAIRIERLKVSKQMVSHLSDSIVNAITVKTFAKESTESDRSKHLSDKLTAIRIRDWSRTTSNESDRMSVLLVVQAALILCLIMITKNNPALLATGIFAFTYSIGIISRFFTINTAVRNIDDALLQAVPITEMLDEPIEILDKPQAEELNVTSGAIHFENVAFRYADASKDDSIFKDLDLVIKPGEKVGLVGHSGGGKTTLTRILLRFDDISSGVITIDGQNIADVTQKSLREQIAYVPQEPLLFHRTIKENIAYAHPDASMKQVKQAAEKAYAADFIEALPKGFDTVVGERGVKLSGGQRQRVAIARAILKSAPILVLDEATSALDSESEKAIQAALWELMKDKTAIVIAHRLSTIQRMDRIIVLDEGRIVEQGSHKELIGQNGTYAKLWAHQSGGFIEE